MIRLFQVKLRCPKCGRTGQAQLEEWTSPAPEKVPSTLKAKTISSCFKVFERPSDCYGNIDFECIYHPVSAEVQL